MEPGDPWYLSGIFWTIVGVAVTVTLGVTAVWATFRSANPRRRLYIYLERTFPVVRAHEAILGEIEVHHLGRILSQPHVVTLNVVSRGRKDISSSSFDGNRPIVVNLSVPIVRMLEEKSTSPERSIPEPESVIDGTKILIGPSMLAKRHVLTYTALVEGRPNLTTETPLLDVECLEGRPNPPQYGRIIPAAMAAVGGIVAAVILQIIVIVFD